MAGKPDSGKRTVHDSVRSNAIVRAAADFFWRNRWYFLRDLTVSVVWAVALLAAFVALSLPGWLYYLLLVGGLLVYSLVTSLLGAAARFEW